MKNLYVAYGSNLNLEQMSLRCPTAKIVGTSELDGYEMLFRGNNRCGVATVEPLENGKVPVLIWDIQQSDLEALDRYEGYPFFYDRKNIDVKHGQEIVSAMIYIMNEGINLSTPSEAYYTIIYKGYKSAGFDIDILDKAVERTIELGLEEEQSNGFNIKFY